MKKLFIILTLVLSISLIGAGAVLAEEVTPSAETFQLRLDKITERFNTSIDRINEREATIRENIQKRAETTERIINQVDPSLWEDFDSAFNNHLSLHQQLLSTRISLKTDFYNQYVTDASAYYTELLAQFNNGQLSAQELSENMKAFTKARYSEYKSTKEDFQAVIADQKAANEANRELLKGYKTTLKTAMEESNQESAVNALKGIYDIMLLHQEFDSYKLSLLQNITY